MDRRMEQTKKRFVHNTEIANRFSQQNYQPLNIAMARCNEYSTDIHIA